MEQAKSGQIGHPAACMMENKAKPPRICSGDYRLQGHPHELWITLGISPCRALDKPHESKV